MIDVRVHRNFPLNCIKLIIVVWPACCPVFCRPVLGMAELLEVLEDNLLSSPSLLVSQAWSIPIPLNIMVRLIESWTRAQSLLLVTVSRGDTIKQSTVGMMGGFAHKRLQLILGDLSATSVR